MALDKFRAQVDIAGLLLSNIIVLFLTVPALFCAGILPAYVPAYQILMLLLILVSYVMLYFKYKRNTNAWLETRNSIVDLAGCVYTPYRAFELPQLSYRDRQDFDLLEGSPK